LPSIEIADDDTAGAPLQQPQTSLRQASADVGMQSIEQSDDNVVEVIRTGVAPSQARGRKRSGSETEINVASFYRTAHPKPHDDGKTSSPVKRGPPSSSAPQHGSKQNSDRSPYFGTASKRVDTPSKVKTTYRRAHRTRNAGQMIDLTDD
jgi:hypothetical protein